MTTTATVRPAAAGGAVPSRRRFSVPVRAWTATTPGRMRLLSLAAVAAIILAWVLALGAVGHRRAGLSAFAARSEPSVVVAQRIQTELTDADSSAANGFLAGGVEPAAQLQRYQQGLAAAADDLAQAAAQGGSAAPVRTIAEQVGVYAGLVQAAKSDNRVGFPVGAAYLRSASQVLRTRILPAAAGLAQDSARGVNRGAGAATAVTDVLVVLGGTVLAVVVLVAAQVFLSRRTRRAVNVGLALATVAMVVLGGVVLGDLSSERSAVVSANTHAYASAARLAQAEVIAFQARGDESQALIARGNGQAYEADFDAAVTQLRGLIGAVAGSVTTTAAAPAVQAAGPGLDAYVALDRAIRADDAGGRHDQAVALAEGNGPGGGNAVFGALQAQLDGALG
ncbi:MAG TPA: hypothetical protein VGI06_06335, partial [Acidimicrobiales bacterium]